MPNKVVNTYHTGYPDLDQLGAALLVVLTQGEIGDFSVYTGIVQLDCFHPDYQELRNAAAHEVALHGNKEPYARAVTYFPGITADNYRP